ncbi:hypothetical protein GGI21_003185, partial [Coemansia aciculifera]
MTDNSCESEPVIAPSLTDKSQDTSLPPCLDKDSGKDDDMQEQVFDRRMRALLNRLTPGNFDEVSDELVAWGNKSAKETDGRILRHLIALVYQQAIDEPVWSNMQARLCHKLIYNIDIQVEDHSLLTEDGNYFCGEQLVRKYLLTKCQEDFERGWKAEVPPDMKSDEYYEAMKVKRRALGLVQLISELFFLDIIKPPMLHEYVKHLLSNIEPPENEDIESLAKLILIAGKKMDTPECKDTMDTYFAHIQAMS